MAKTKSTTKPDISKQTDEIKQKICDALGAPQELAGADDLFLADEFFEGARAHAGSQRGFGIDAFLHGVVKEVGHGVIVPFEEWKRLSTRKRLTTKSHEVHEGKDLLRI
jgi:hypothetical protein